MSNLGEKLQTIAVIDPVVNLEHQAKYGVYNAGMENTYQVFPSQSNTSISQVTIVCPPPDYTTIVHPQPYMSSVLNIALTGTTTGGANLFDFLFGNYISSNGAGVGGNPVTPSRGTDGLRAYPLSQMAQTITITMNGYPVTTNMAQQINAFLRYNNFVHDQDFEYSVTPAMLDQYQMYFQAVGSNRNPLGDYSSDSTQVTRGSYISYNATNVVQTTTSCSFSILVVEPILVSPFYFNKRGISGISTMTFNLVQGNLQRAWSSTGLFGGVGVTSVTVVPQQYNLFFRYITAKMTEYIPRSLVYQYFSVQTISNVGSIITHNALDIPLNMNLTATNLIGIPNRIYIYMRKNTNSLTAFDADCYAYINNISVFWANRSGLLSSAQPSDLYEMSRIAGTNINYIQFQNQIGSVVCLEIAKVLGLNDLKAAGVLDNPQFSIQVHGSTNIPVTATPQAFAYEVFAQVIYEGVFSVDNGTVSTSITPLSSLDVLRDDLSGIEIVGKKSENFFGGDFFEEVEKIIPYVKSGIEVAQTLAGYRKKKKGKKGSSRSIKSKKSSRTKRSSRKKTSKSICQANKRRRAGILVGGQMISRSDLRDNYDDIDDYSDDSDY
jgi:hypothetical protein